MSLRETLQPGDLITDIGGYPVVRYWSKGYSEKYLSPPGLFRKVVQGEVSTEEYARVAMNHARALRAFDEDLSLPKGAAVVPPTVEEVRDRAEIFSADLFFRAMRHARQAAQR